MSECADIGIRLPRHKWPTSRSNIEDPVGPLERNLYGHPLAGLLWERQSEEFSSWNLDGKKVPSWECLFVHRKQGLFLSVDVGWHQNDWKEAGICFPCGRTCWKMLILENQHHVLTMYTWDAFHVCAHQTRMLSANTEKCWEPRIAVAANEKKKTTRMGETSRKNGGVVIRHGMTWSKVRWQILWTGK